MIGAFARAMAGAVAALLACIWMIAPARADDTINVVSGATPAAFFEVLGDVAEYAGFYKEQHLIVNKNYAGNPGAATQLVASGKGDVVTSVIEPLISGYDKGLRLVDFFSRDPGYEWVVGVLDTSPIRTLSDFKGTTIGEISLGDPSEMVVEQTLAGAGLKKSDYTLVPIGVGAAAVAAMTSKKVDGVAFPYPELGIDTAVTGLKFRYFWHPILKDIGDVGYAASPDTLKNKSDELKRFSRAIAKAAILIRVNPKVAARYFLQGEGLKPTPEAIDNEAHLLAITQDQLPGFDPTSKTIGKMSANGMGFLANFLYQNGLTKVVVPTSSLVSDEFIAYANDFDHVKFIAQAKAMK
jgi:NitT/TauT family transport system substrate-binding protein